MQFQIPCYARRTRRELQEVAGSQWSRPLLNRACSRMEVHSIAFRGQAAKRELHPRPGARRSNLDTPACRLQRAGSRTGAAGPAPLGSTRETKRWTLTCSSNATPTASAYLRKVEDAQVEDVSAALAV